MIVPTSSWIAVRKERRLRLYSLAARGGIATATADEIPAEGCGVELTRLTVAGEAWWTLGFEAFGGAVSFREHLLPVIEHVFAQGRVPTLGAQSSYSYPTWLAALP
jgi:hypothetical protein